MSASGLPAWARDEAFSEKPSSAPFGRVDGKGSEQSFSSLDELGENLARGKGRLAWVWTPDHDRLIAPEEVPELAQFLKKRRLFFAALDVSDAKRSLPFTIGAILFALFHFFQGSSFMGHSGALMLVFSGFGFLYFTARPWWEAIKGRKGAKRLDAQTMADDIPEARFDLWMDSQKTLFSVVMVALVSVVFLVQFPSPGLGIEQAGLVKEAYRAGETWRVFTAAFMHGNVIHFALNIGALWYLARRLEILARWPHLLAVFILSMMGAGWATTALLPAQTSVGVSGVVCGMLGFLLVFETLHLPLVPRPARRRLFGILVSLVVIGALGFHFIDNAAHFGGLISGAAYAFLVFPKSCSPQRPVILKRDYVMGVIVFAMLVASAALTVYMILRA